MDEHKWDWDDAWQVTKKCFAYTCHTLLPEALEVWPVDLLGRLLPRHLEIIYQINDTFLDEVRERYPNDEMRVRSMSIVTDYPDRSVRMAYLATVAGMKVNGVAALHSQLLAEKVLPAFSEFWPEKFTNVTNGVTPRRFLRLANPWLSQLITDALGVGWVTDLDRLSELEPYAEDEEFRKAFRAAKQTNKNRLYALLRARDGIELSGDHLLDVMVKRLHEYKRQTLKILHVVSLYEQIIHEVVDPESITPRTVVFGAKAAPGLPAGQGDHLSDQQGRTDCQRRRAGGGTTADRLPSELQRHFGREADPRGRPLGADLAGRHGGVGHRQHEVRPERRAHHRYR